YRKLPKRGFHNRFSTEYAVINLAGLSRFEDGAVVDLGILRDAGLVKSNEKKLKVLGNGEITKKITVKAAVFSASAKEKIEAAGGKTEVV
ncbi:MAG: 50S ribosomal protein L15, partial [Clostridia bacterium]|nr:50S ribosomal protein L15 [Clostridia bacterium]